MSIALADRLPSVRTALPAAMAGLTVRLLGPDAMEEILALRAEVLASLSDADLYVRERDERDFVGRHLASAGLTVGVFDGTRLVAYAALGVPGRHDPDNLGYVLGMSDEERSRVAHLASCMVHPSYRGRGLQRSLTTTRYALCRVLGRTSCLAMVSLRNHPSRHNLLSSGMEIRWVGTLLGDLHRQVLGHDLERRDAINRRWTVLVASDDFARQVALTQGHHAGFGEERQNGSVWLKFAPLDGDQSRKISG